MRHVMVDPASGSAATLHPGDVLEVRLLEPGAAGHRWSAATVPTHLEPRGSRTAPARPERDSRMHVLRFEAAGPGCGLLVLTLPSESEAVDCQVRELVISVVRG